MKKHQIYKFLMLSIIFLFCFIGAILVYPSKSPESNIPKRENNLNNTEMNPESAKNNYKDAADNRTGFSSSENCSDSNADSAYNDKNNAVYNSEEKTMHPTNITEDMVPTNRTIYQEGFYYEPLSEEIKQRITGISYKENPDITYDDLRYVSVLYVDFEGNTQNGEIICNQAIAWDLVEIFAKLYAADYPIEKIRLIDEYGGDDDLSCADNNTSCFNYRVVGGTDTLSKHALGLAIDINPFQNPYITYPNGVERISPGGSEPYADRDSGLPHMILKDDLCYRLFTERGFTWGGEWKSLKDYQHFQKTP